MDANPRLGIRLRPMGLGDILDETFRLYRANFLTFVVATAVVAVPVALLSGVLTLALGTGAQSEQMPSPAMIMTAVAAGIPLAVIAFLGYFLSGAATVKLASGAILGEPIDVGSSYRSAFGRLGSLFLASFLAGLAVMGLFITVLGIPFAIYLGIGWALATHAIMLEGCSGTAALSRSSSLVSGHRWRTLGLSILIGILVSILQSIPAALVGGLSGGAALLEGGNASASMALQVMSTLMSALGQFLFGCLTWIVLTLLYYDLRVRKEAFDLEQVSDRLEDGASQQP